MVMATRVGILADGVKAHLRVEEDTSLFDVLLYHMGNIAVFRFHNINLGCKRLERIKCGRLKVL